MRFSRKSDPKPYAKVSKPTPVAKAAAARLKKISGAFKAVEKWAGKVKGANKRFKENPSKLNKFFLARAMKKLREAERLANSLLDTEDRPSFH